MKPFPFIHRFLRLASRRRIQVVILILGLQILLIGPVSKEGYSWGSFRGALRSIRVTDTHQEIIKAAFGMLSRDPVITKTRFPQFGDFSVITAEDILQYEGVDPSRDNRDWSFRTEGPGPDADGSTPYSWHWSNPVTYSGSAPKAAADQYLDFALAALQTNFSRERALKGMAWSAHFVADMFVPFHVNGVPVFDADPEPGPGPFIMNNDESGPLFLCNTTPSLLTPSSYEDTNPYIGYGLDNDFSKAYANFKEAREDAQPMDNGVNPLDWFDPWYWNGSVAAVLQSSHVSFESRAHAEWLNAGGINNPAFAGYGRYDKLWENGLPDYTFSGTATATQAEQVWRFVRRVAFRTKESTQQLFMSPSEGVFQSVFAVYTLWRSAWSALQPVIKVSPDPVVPGKVTVSTLVSNYAQEACQNVWIRLTVLDGSAIAYQGNMPLTANLPGTQSAWTDWSFQAEQNRSYVFFMEVVGAYMVTPDLQYAYCSLPYQSGPGPQNNEPEVFGNNQWIQNSLTGDIYYLPEGTTRLPDFTGMQSVGRIYTKSLNIPERAFDSGFPNVTSRFEWFAIRYTGEIRIRADREGMYAFRLTSDDGSKLLIDNKVVIDNDGQHATAAATGSIFLSEGIHKIEIEYFQGPRLHVALVFEVLPPGAWLYSIFNKDDY